MDTDTKITYQVYFYNEPKLTMDYKILDACRQYYQKYKRSPNQVLVNPEDFKSVIGDFGLNTNEHKIVKSMMVKPDQSVLLGYIYVGEFNG